MKLVREHINEVFTDDSDPIRDMGIGMIHKIEKWLEDARLQPHEYTITENGEIDMKGDLDLGGQYKLFLPNGYFPDYIQFNKVLGYFNVGSCNLNSLRGSPREVGFYVSVGNNHFTSFEGGPEQVFTEESGINGNFGYDAEYNHIESLEGLPKEIDGNLWIRKGTFTEKKIKNVCAIKGRLIFTS